MTKSKYSRIRTAQELDRAIEALESETKMRTEGIKGDYRAAKNFYTPVNLFNWTLDRISPAFNLAGIGLELYDRIKERIDAFRHRSKERKADAQTKETDAQETADASASENVND